MRSTDSESLTLLPFKIRVSKTDTRSPLKNKLSIIFILVAIVLERLVFYALAGNLSYLLQINANSWTYPNTLILSLIFIGMSHISAIFSAWVSDGKLGRAKTIIIGYILYIVGYLLVCFLFVKNNGNYIIGNDKIAAATTPTTTIPPFFNAPRVGYILVFLLITAIGVGIVQANCVAFGAEQARDNDGNISFFYFYYGAVNVGAIGGYVLSAFLIDNNYILIFLGILVLSFLLFCVGYNCYYHVDPYDSVFFKFILIMCNACSVCVRLKFPSKSQNPDYVEHNGSGNSNTSESSFMRYASQSHGGRFLSREISDTQQILRFTALFLLMLPYWVITVQPETTFIVQGTHMRLPNGSARSILWFSLPDPVIIVVIVIFLSLSVIFFGARRMVRLSISQKLLIGFMLATCSMISAGTTEIFREKADNVPQYIGNIIYTASDISVFFQFPQYILIGLAEIFASIASLELIYVSAPDSAQSLGFSLHFFFRGLASFIVSIVVGIVQAKNDTRGTNGNLKNVVFSIYFYSLAVLQIIGIVAFHQFRKKSKLFDRFYREQARLSI